MEENRLFDFDTAEKQKRRGMAIAALSRPSELELARNVARELCLSRGSTTADEVGKVIYRNYGIESLGPAAGSLFKGGDFEPTGEMRKSSRKSNHARLLFVWRLKG